MQKVWKTLVETAKDEWHSVDTIEYEGGTWLVPKWLDGPTTAFRKPARLVRVDLLSSHEIGGLGGVGRTQILSVPIPKSVLEGTESPADERITVLQEPELCLRVSGY